MRNETTHDVRSRKSINVGSLSLGFQRTCRVPVGKQNYLPAGLGPFPIFEVEHFSDRAPKEWDKKDYFMPMYQCEALWINFNRQYHKQPKAVMVGSGAINAVTGEKMNEYKLKDPQNYLVVPPQPWLDGWKDTDGKIYQFVAADLGSGQTIEGQITGEEKVGGIQLATFKPKPDADLIPESRPREHIVAGDWWSMGWESDKIPMPKYFGGFFGDLKPHRYECFSVTSGASQMNLMSSVAEKPVMKKVRSMGLGRGGEILQKIYPDPYGLEVWEASPAEARTVHIVNSEDFREVTGHNPPPTPINYKTYQQYGYPWFDLWDKELKDTKGSDIFSKLKPVE